MKWIDDSKFRSFEMCYKMCIAVKVYTSLLCDHVIVGGGSGANFTTHVRFIVDPRLMKMSVPPTISVIGSKSNNNNTEFMYTFWKYVYLV